MNLTRRRCFDKRRLLYHFLNGVWSGIPLCCVIYWCRGYHGMNRDKPDHNYRESNYVRCNKCVTEKRSVRCRRNGRVAAWLIS